MNNIVFIKGNIIFKSGDHHLKELVAYASNEWLEIADEIIDGDLTITDKDEVMPYKIYCAANDIILYGNFISVMQRPDEVIRIFREEINNLRKLRNQKINDELELVLNRQIYIGVVGTMELFLCDFLYSMVLGTQKYYTRFCENTSRAFKLKEISSNAWKTQTGVIRTIIETNYHRIQDINKIYKKVLNVEFPSSDKLPKQILTRHSLVHRNGFPSKNSEYVKVSEDMIEDLINEVDTLVNHIINTMKHEIKKWFPDPVKKKPTANNGEHS